MQTHPVIMRFSLQEPHLTKLRDEQTPVMIALANGVKLYGRIESFDQFAIIIVGEEQQMVYKSAISNIQVGRPGAVAKPRTGMTHAPRREFNPIPRGGDDRPLSPAQKEPVVIVRKKLRTIVPSSER